MSCGPPPVGAPRIHLLLVAAGEPRLRLERRVVIAITGWTPIDPLLSLAIGALILVSSLRLLRETLHGLMEGAPFNIDPQDVGLALAGVPGVASVHDLHIWSVAADRPILTAHLVVREITEWNQVMDSAHSLLKREFGIVHATLQPEPMVRPVQWKVMDGERGQGRQPSPQRGGGGDARG